MLGDKIRELRGSMTQKDLAKKLGISTSAVGMYEQNRREPDLKTLKKIAGCFDVTLDRLMDYQTNETETKGAPEEMPLLPVVGRVCAGNGILAAENIIDYEPCEKKYADAEHFWLKVSGDSMSPRIDDGDLLLIRKQTSVDSGDVGVFVVDGQEGVVKKVVYDADSIELISFNPYYPPMKFSGKDVLRVRVSGKVIESKRKW
ncbi:MAG: helix-turn-helix domain-containing protein [Clostridia bacterium]|nr:helix-turn-helix domain-containing protein [Clostridia bacterium]